MNYTLTFRDSFWSDLARLPRNFIERMENINAELRDDPMRLGGNIKKLKGFQRLYRYRVEDHRIIYAVIDQIVEYIAIGPRRDIYDRLRYNPEQPDERLTAEVEATLFPESVASIKAQQHQLYEQLAELQQELLDPPLPEPLTRDKLEEWRIPAKYHSMLISCKTKRQFDAITSVPLDIMVKLVDYLWPKSVEAISTQPVRVLQTDDEFTLYVEGKISEFLLKLDDQQKALVSWALEGPTMVTGGPGSGKSTVAMYRARALLERAREMNEPRPRCSL